MARGLKRYFLYECIDTINKLVDLKTPSHDDCYSKLKNSNPFEKDFRRFSVAFKTGLTEVKKNSGSKANHLGDWKTTAV